MPDLGFKGKVPGAFRVPDETYLTSHRSVKAPELVLPNFAFFIPDALSAEDCKLLSELFARQDRAPVAVSGYQTSDSNQVGSVRATGWGPELSKLLWDKIRDTVRPAICATNRQWMTDQTPTDWFATSARKEHKLWIPTGISPVLRFMEYKHGGKHNTHYDMGFDYEAHNPKDLRRTLLSIVWYLNDEPNTGGRTRFIEDGQGHLPIQKRDLNDWVRSASDSEVLAAKAPHQGGALLFWHRMAHDVEEFTGNSRIIIRGDIEFTAL